MSPASIPRQVGRGIFVLLLLAAGSIPTLHAAQHDDPENHCFVCIVAHAGAPALIRQSVSLGPTPDVEYLPVSDTQLAQHDRHWSPVAGRAPPHSPV
ncbi:MAG: hypothetical protein JSW67_08890 [Candidatus Latescibacterota bacterium]|nr:MAG: hypothetical protein JSW67_08890 [Candidatus Latescibacterota bacterium]